MATEPEVVREESGHLLPNLIHFTRLLRDLGLPVTPDDAVTLSEALQATGLDSRRDAKAAARAVLVGRKEHLSVFEQAFDHFFRTPQDLEGPIDLGRVLIRGRGPSRQLQAMLPAPAASAPGDGREIEQPFFEPTRTWSANELLRRKDFAELTEQEAAEVLRLLREKVFTPPPRRTRQRVAAPEGAFPDPRRTLRRSLRWGGEPLELAFRRRKVKRRPLVVLADVSGSMEPYARMLLQFLYALSSSTDRLEAFVFGTRLTRITRELAHRDMDRALKEATAAVVDWGGGTRIGESLRRFNFDWGRRVLGQGAVVLVISDGWDRGDPELVSREMARLARSCERLIWLNPLIATPGFEPLTRGLQAALPHVDDFLPVHNLESLEQLAGLLRGLG